MKEKCVCTSNQGWPQVWVHVSSSTKSPVDCYLRPCVCVCVCVCNGSTPGSSIRCAPQMCVCVWAQLHKIKGGHGCVCVSSIMTTINSYLCVYVCACIPTSLNVCNYIRPLDCSLLLIMKYFVLKIVYSHRTTPCNLSAAFSKKITHRTHSLFASTQKADAWYKCNNFRV